MLTNLSERLTVVQRAVLALEQSGVIPGEVRLNTSVPLIEIPTDYGFALFGETFVVVRTILSDRNWATDIIAAPFEGCELRWVHHRPICAAVH